MVHLDYCDYVRFKLAVIFNYSGARDHTALMSSAIGLFNHCLNACLNDWSSHYSSYS